MCQIAKVSKVCLLPEQLQEGIKVPGAVCVCVWRGGGRGHCTLFFGDSGSAGARLAKHISGNTCFPPWLPREVPGEHIPAHTGKRPHRSPSSARQSSPRYWARQVLGSCSSPPLEKTDRRKGEWTSTTGQWTRRLRVMLAAGRRGVPPNWAFPAL